jgi:hypothetical protein
MPIARSSRRRATDRRHQPALGWQAWPPSAWPNPRPSAVVSAAAPAADPPPGRCGTFCNRSRSACSSFTVAAALAETVEFGGKIVSGLHRGHCRGSSCRERFPLAVSSPSRINRLIASDWDGIGCSVVRYSSISCNRSAGSVMIFRTLVRTSGMDTHSVIHPLYLGCRHASPMTQELQ